MLARWVARSFRLVRPPSLGAGAVGAFLLLAVAGSWPLTASAAGQVQPTSRALCAPAAPGYVSCLALIRTDVAPLAKAAVAPHSTPSGFDPSQLQSAYALPAPASGAGSGMTVAVVDYSDHAGAEADLATYRSQFGLSPCTTANGCFRKIDENGGTSYSSYPVDPGWGGEIALDIEMVSAICPNCHILLVEAQSASLVDVGTAENTAVSQGAKFITNSYGAPETFGETSADNLYFNHPGVAITVSTGDSGYGVEFPASSQHVTAVGGTSLSTASNARGWTETAWNLAGSGCSSQESKPAWQQDASCSKRTVADVAAVADAATGVAVYSSPDGGWVQFGGTSVASPIIAGVYALAGAPAAGTYPSSYLYSQTGQLNDVTSGSNGSCSGLYLCTAGVGYDGPTGLGTPNGTGAFRSPVLPGAPSSVTGIGADSAVAVSWHAAPGNGHPITGYAVTATPDGATCTTTGTLTCTVSGLTNGTTYTFRVTATNSVGTGPASVPSAGVIPATVPGSPTGVSGTPADGSAVITWSAPASTGGLPISGYTATSAPLGRTCTTTGALTCTIGGLANGSSYTFTVTATNPMGTGPASSASSSVTPVAIPGATYKTVTPNRLVDSRSGNGLSSGLTAGQARTFIVTNRALGDATKNIPADAVAVTGNLTVTGQTAKGYFVLAPNALTSTSTLNFPLGDTRANGVTVPLGTNGTNGTLSITYVAPAGNTAQVIFDVTGYFVPAPPG